MLGQKKKKPHTHTHTQNMSTHANTRYMYIKYPRGDEISMSRKQIKRVLSLTELLEIGPLSIIYALNAGVNFVPNHSGQILFNFFITV